MSGRAKERDLEALYARVPKIECRRLCQGACGPIPVASLERKRIRRKHHRLPTVEAGMRCSEVGVLGTCLIYDLRPLICRLWGVVDVDGMRCPHGCVPERWLTAAEGRAMLGELLTLSPAR